MTWGRFFSGLDTVALWSLRGIWGALHWLLKELGKIFKARSADAFRGLLNLCFGSWERIGVFVVASLALVMALNPELFEQIFLDLLALSVTLYGLRVILGPLFPQKKKKARGT